MSKHRDKSLSEIADLIERFLNGNSLYAQEWNDFVDCSQRDPIANKYRKRCDELNPGVNRPDPQDKYAVEELRKMIKELRGNKNPN